MGGKGCYHAQSVAIEQTENEVLPGRWLSREM